MSVVKLSLHESGVWALAATQQSGAMFGNNRRAKQWKRPLEHAKGITRGPSILIPHTSFGARHLSPEMIHPATQWVSPPAEGKAVEFSLYLVAAGHNLVVGPDFTNVAERQLASGSTLVILANVMEIQPQFQTTIEQLLKSKRFTIEDASAVTSGGLLWFTESNDALRVPIIVDLPVPIAERE